VLWCCSKGDRDRDLSVAEVARGLAVICCDLCQQPTHLLEGYLSCPDPDSAEWHFVCPTCPGEFYDFAAHLFLQSPGLMARWLAHLREKEWFDPQKFYELLDRLELN
jgi:hypothetical protein